MLIVMNILRKVFNFLLVCCTSTLSFYASCEDAPISVSMSVESGLLVLKLSNIGEKGMYIAKWDFPYCGKIESDYFDMSSISDGRRPDFLGKVIKRKEPNVSDVFLLDIRKSIIIKVDVKKYYRLKNDTYSVRFNRVMPLYSVTGNVVKISGFTELLSNEVKITMKSQ